MVQTSYKQNSYLGASPRRAGPGELFPCLLCHCHHFVPAFTHHLPFITQYFYCSPVLKQGRVEQPFFPNQMETPRNPFSTSHCSPAGLPNPDLPKSWFFLPKDPLQDVHNRKFWVLALFLPFSCSFCVFLTLTHCFRGLKVLFLTE